MKSTFWQFPLLLALTLISVSAYAVQEASKPSAISAHNSSFSNPTKAIDLPLYSRVYDDTSDPFKDAVAAIKLADTTNRNVLIEIGGNWCTWCHKMDTFLEKNPKVFDALHSKFVLLKINVSDSNENEAFMKSLPPVLGYPHMYVSTAKGKMLLSKDTAELIEGSEYSVKQWLDFLNKWQPSNTKLMENKG
ncbi:MAG: thioredoxin family protein [Colwellia sp.]